MQLRLDVLLCNNFLFHFLTHFMCFRLQRRRFERAALQRHPSVQGDAQLRGQDPVPALGPGGADGDRGLLPDDVVRSRRQPVRHQGARGGRDRRVGQADGQARHPRGPKTYYRWKDASGVPTSPRSRPRRASSTPRSALSTSAP